MAKKKASVEVPAEISEDAVVQSAEEASTVSPAEAPVVTATVELPKEPDFSWVPAALAEAQVEIERCQDYVNTPGADHSERFKASLSEWTEYKYRLRQMVLHKSSKVPSKPRVVPDY